MCLVDVHAKNVLLSFMKADIFNSYQKDSRAAKGYCIYNTSQAHHIDVDPDVIVNRSFFGPNLRIDCIHDNGGRMLNPQHLLNVKYCKQWLIFKSGVSFTII